MAIGFFDSKQRMKLNMSFTDVFANIPKIKISPSMCRRHQNPIIPYQILRKPHYVGCREPKPLIVH